MKMEGIALAGWLGWLEHRPVHQKAAGSIPGRNTYEKQQIDVSLSHRCFSLSLSLFLPSPSSPSKINKHTLR